MLTSTRKILSLLTRSERRNGAIVLLVIIAMALFQALGTVSIMPFLGVLANPELIEEQALLRWAFEAFGFTSSRSFLFALGIVSLVLLVSGSLLQAFAHYVIFRYMHRRGYSISRRLLARYLQQPFVFFATRNSADLTKNILSEVDQLVNTVLKPGGMVVAYSVTALALLALLLVMEPLVALAAFAVLGGAYALIYGTMRRRLRRIGQERLAANNARFTAAAEVLGGIKEVKLFGREETFLKRFEGPANIFARRQAANETISVTPKFFVEALGFGAVILLTLSFLGSGRRLEELLPLVGLYAAAGYRLLPAMQQIYAGAAKVRFGLPAAEALVDDLAQKIEGEVQPRASALPPLPFRREIAFRGVTFRYPGAARPALAAADLTIPAGTTVGFVGGTGAGKTTAADLLLGLLTPESGRIEVDGIVLEGETRYRWQAAIGYVPQHNYLVDATIAANIAFGIPEGEIDLAAVERAARIAQLHDFITSDLPQGYQTVVGERGARLSGGQRQRIGIARALYHDPPVLVLDEATSALDTVTEAAVMEGIYGLGGKTIILIAHRLSTVRRCDAIAVFRLGELVGYGSLEALQVRNCYFRGLSTVAPQ